MKKLYLALAFLIFHSQAVALCIGGYDGTTGNLSGCSEIGDFGSLIYERNESGLIIKKRNDEEIKSYIQNFVRDRFKNRGITVKNEDIKIYGNTITFDIRNQNGDKVYTYTLSKDGGLIENEQRNVDARTLVDQRKRAESNFRLNRINRMKTRKEELKKEQAMKEKQ